MLPFKKQSLFTILIATLTVNCSNISLAQQINMLSYKTLAASAGVNSNLYLGSNGPETPSIVSLPTMRFSQAGSSQQVIALRDAEAESMIAASSKAYAKWLLKSQYYRDAYYRLLKMNPDSFSVAEAVYLVENAYVDGKLSHDAFIQAIQLKAALVKQIVKRTGLSTKNNTALNYGIQRLYSHQNLYYNTKAKESFLIPPLRYRFEDFEGQKDYTNMFVSKLLTTSKGQCHSLPLLYLLIAEQLGVKAYLSLAPQHSFIKFPDEHGTLFNFETTNGSIVSNSWITQSGYITAKALQQHTYFDTLSSRQLYAQMLNDLMLGYLHKFPYDDFVENIGNKAVTINPHDITAMIIEANINTQKALAQIRAVGNPQEVDLPKYKDAYNAYQTMHASYDKVDATGFQDMPVAAYQKWLRSIETEKKRQATIETRLQLERELHELNKNTLIPLKVN